MSKPREERELLYKTLQNTTAEIPNNDRIILIGDFNARVDSEPPPNNFEKILTYEYRYTS